MKNESLKLTDSTENWLSSSTKLDKLIQTCVTQIHNHAYVTSIFLWKRF